MPSSTVEMVSNFIAVRWNEIYIYISIVNELVAIAIYTGAVHSVNIQPVSMQTTNNDLIAWSCFGVDRWNVVLISNSVLKQANFYEDSWDHE